MFPETLSNNTSASVICLYPLSGQYELLQRILYWVIVTFTIFWHSHRWLVAGAFATVMLYSSTAIIHAIILYGARSKSYYETDAVAICEIVICSAVLVPAYLAHSKNLDSLAKRILLQMWGAWLFLGGIFAILLMTHVVKRVIPESYPCGDWTNTTWSDPFLEINSWKDGSNCSSPIIPCSNAIHLLRPLDDIKIIKGNHSLGHWTNVIAYFSTWLGFCSVLVIVISIIYPAGTKRRKEWLQEQIKKQRKSGRAKGNHPADTPQLPLVIAGGMAFLGCCEKTLSLVPRSEEPKAIGQWGTWVQLAMVLFSVLVLRMLVVMGGEGDGEGVGERSGGASDGGGNAAVVPKMKVVSLKDSRTKGVQTNSSRMVTTGTSTEVQVDGIMKMPRNTIARIVKRFTDPVTALEKGNLILTAGELDDDGLKPARETRTDEQKG